MGFSLSHLLVVLVIVILLFGTSKLKTIGSDLGGALKNFRKAMSEDGEDTEKKSLPEKDKPSQDQ